MKSTSLNHCVNRFYLKLKKGIAVWEGALEIWSQTPKEMAKRVRK